MDSALWFFGFAIFVALIGISISWVGWKVNLHQEKKRQTRESKSVRTTQQSKKIY